MDRTRTLLTERRALLEKTAQRLLEKETLDEAELLQLVAADEPRLPDRAIVEVERGRQGRPGSSEAAQGRDGMRP
jgi:cell division protease FtsH